MRVLFLLLPILFNCPPKTISQNTAQPDILEIVTQIAKIDALYAEDYEKYVSEKERLSYLKGKVSNYEISPDSDVIELRKKLSQTWRSESYRDYQFASSGVVYRVVDEEKTINSEWELVGNKLKRSRPEHDQEWTETIVYIDSKYLLLKSASGAVVFYSKI